MQASGRTAKSVICTAVKMFEVQDDPLEVVGIAGERVQGLRRTAPVNNAAANLGWKAFDVLWIIAIFAAPEAAAFR